MGLAERAKGGARGQGVTIRILGSADEAAYRTFLNRTPNALIYATLEYREFLKRVVPGRPRYLIAVERRRVAGTLPSFEHDVPGLGTIVNSLPWYGSHGGCVIESDASSSVRTALLAAYRSRLDERAVAFSTMSPSFDEESEIGAYVDVLEPREMDHRIGQVTPLPPASGDVEASLMGTYRQKTRNLVRKSLKQGFIRSTTDDDEAWSFLHEVHAENMTSIGGRAKPREHFEALRATIPPAWRSLSVAVLDGEPVAALLVLRFGRTAEYFVPVIRQAYRSLQPLSFLIHRGMLDAVRDGCERWNWGGTWESQTSLRHFKNGWGAEERRYSYLTRATDEGLRLLHGPNRDEFIEAAPWYYLYPFDRLNAGVIDNG